MLKTNGIKLKKGMSAFEKYRIADQINAADPKITKHEAYVGVLGLTNKTMNRRVYGPLFDQPTMYLGRSSPGLSPEYINNEIMYSGSQKQKEKENNRIDDIYSIQTQEDLGQSVKLEDQQPTMPLIQEKMLEKQQQVIERSCLKGKSYKNL
ncbi:MAG: hypothetical protein EZS28_010890 [Streblomastix strix]|uniref:Uncharacterized protein n=1 Tax=Streblomastix strix TaxID=222440 RepID=A0A5J4WF24_9EUKA|nr:MAG: hypothetical protein EZS28_010890 [Streblomastix strix]